MAGLTVSASLVMMRIAAASWSNVLQKQVLTQNKSAFSLLVEIWGWMTLLSVPAWLLAATNTGSTVFVSFWLWMLAACVLEILGNWLLLRSIQQTDLSIYGPLNSFKPAIGMIAGILLLAEYPSSLGLLGMSVVILGSFWLPAEMDGQTVTRWRSLFVAQGVRDRLLAMCMTAIASVLLKRAMPGATPWEVLGVWCLLGWTLAVVVHRATQQFHNWDRIANMRETAPASQVCSRLISMPVFLIAVSMLLMQGLTITIFRLMPVAYALALFQLGSLVSVYLGHRIFGEPNLWRRLTASVIMVLGAMLIVFST